MAVNFKTVFDTAPFGQYFINTCIIATISTLLAVVVTVLASFAFSVLEFKGKKFWFWLFLSTMMVPTELLIIQNYVTVSHLGWLDTYLPLVIPSLLAGDTYFVYMLIQFLRGIPRELEEAAEIDGCNVIQRLWYVIAPMLKPSIVSCALFQFMWSSNDFMGPLIYVNTVSKYPVSNFLRMSMDMDTGFEWNRVLAMSLLAIVPTLIVFFLAQSSFVDGIAAGGIKG